MEVRVNIDECIGCGVCAQLCPQMFETDEVAGKCVIKQQLDTPEVKNAVEACPVSALKINE